MPSCFACSGTGMVPDIDGGPRPCSRCSWDAFERWAASRRRKPAAKPALDDLRAELERAERQLLCDDMIDSAGRRERETAKSQARVAELRAQIQRIEETF